MPDLAHKLAIVAAVDGLVLKSPDAHPKHRCSRDGESRSPAISIDYESHKLSRWLGEHSAHEWYGCEAQNGRELKAFGIIGLLRIPPNAYLLAITKCEEVAQIFQKPVYVITHVAAIPLIAQAEAEIAIQQAATLLTNSSTPAQSDGDDDKKDMLTRETTLSVEEEALDEDAEDDSSAGLEGTWLDEKVSEGWRSQIGAGKATNERRNSEPGIVEDVITRKGLYGRFAERWFSSRGLGLGQRPNTHANMPQTLELPETGHQRSSSAATASPCLDINEEVLKEASLTESRTIRKVKDVLEGKEASDEDLVKAMLPKVAETMRLLLTSRTFFFSYDFNLTTSLASQDECLSDVPLYRSADPQYFWNLHLASPFMEAQLDQYALPILHGFVGQRSIELPSSRPASSEKASSARPAHQQTSKYSGGITTSGTAGSSYLLTLISRKSTRRAGLRYLRRGINTSGHVANSVETEQLLSPASWALDNAGNQTPTTHGGTFTFLQTRGSLPLYFSQSPYTFKPIPTLHGSFNTNQAAFRQHFISLSQQYGNVHAVNLLDRHGSEVAIGESYVNHVQALNSSDGLDGKGKALGFEWFDFHATCRGMKFENVSNLVNTLIPCIESNGWNTIVSSPPTSSSAPSNHLQVKQKQTGIIRTNCMDCLDRTNVVQSSFAQHVLARQLAHLLGPSPSSPSSTLDLDSPTTIAFSTLWADNGDALSLAYTGTSALKGDFTRTRRRTPLGALTDLSLTLHRYQRNLFEDDFTQVVVDLALGNRGAEGLIEYAERGSGEDVGLVRFWEGARMRGVEAAAGRAVEGGESVLAGWVLRVPATATLKSDGDAAGLRAQPFAEVILILTDASLRLTQYDFSAEHIVSSRAVPLEDVTSIKWGTYVTDTRSARQVDTEQNAGFVLRVGAGGVLAFKAAYLQHQQQGRDARTSEREFVREIVAVIAETAVARQRAIASANASGGRDGGIGGVDEVGLPVVEEGTVLSAEEARRAVSWREELEYGVRRIIWG